MEDKGVETSLYHPLHRLEYDAYRTDLEELSLGPRDAGTRGRLESAQATFQAHRDKYEKLRGDVAIKLKFLEENKVPTPPFDPLAHLPVCNTDLLPRPPPIIGWENAAWLRSGIFP